MYWCIALANTLPCFKTISTVAQHLLDQFPVIQFLMLWTFISWDQHPSNTLVEIQSGKQIVRSSQWHSSSRRARTCAGMRDRSSISCVPLDTRWFRAMTSAVIDIAQDVFQDCPRGVRTLRQAFVQLRKLRRHPHQRMFNQDLYILCSSVCQRVIYVATKRTISLWSRTHNQKGMIFFEQAKTNCFKTHSDSKDLMPNKRKIIHKCRLL